MEDWLNRIRRSQADFTEPEPDGLWEGIEAGLEAADRTRAAGTATAGTAVEEPTVSRRRSPLLWWAAAAAAAAAALVLFLAVPGRETAPGDASPVPPSKLPLAVVEESPDRNSPAEPVTDRLLACSEPSSSQKSTPADAVAEPKGGSGRETPEGTPAEVAAETADGAGRDSGKQTIEDGQRPAKDEQRAYGDGHRHIKDEQQPSGDEQWPAEAEKPARRSRGSGFAVGLLASNVAGSRSTSSEYAALYGSTVTRQIHGFSETAADFPDSQGYAGVMQSNADNEISSNIKHFQPVQVGVSISYSFTDRLSLESGLTYSCLISDISSGTQSGNYDIRQTLHYVGIPLNLRYDFLKFNKFSLYVSAGGQVEKCVAGKTRTDYFVDGKKISSENGGITVKPLQWSVNAHVGAQYSFNRIVGLYLEPGAAWYFNNGSPVNCIYGERPFNFSLRAGLRFSLQ